MKKKFNVFKRKLHSLIERIKLSESEYLSMKSKAQMYSDMMSTVKCECNTDYEDIKNNGHAIARFPKSRTMTLNIDVEQMLASGGITFDKNAVKLNVK